MRVGQNKDPFSCFKDISLGQLRENNGFSSTCRELEEHVIPFWKFFHSAHQCVDGILLVTVQGLSLIGFQLFAQRRVSVNDNVIQVQDGKNSLKMASGAKDKSTSSFCMSKILGERFQRKGKGWLESLAKQQIFVHVF